MVERGSVWVGRLLARQEERKNRVATSRWGNLVEETGGGERASEGKRTKEAPEEKKSEAAS